MEMKPDDYKKYLAKWGSPVPKQGRYAPHGQFFQCETQEQIDALEAAGWTDSALDHNYKPEEAIYVERFEDVTLTSSVRTLKPREKTQKEKLAELIAKEQAAQAPAVDVAALQQQLAAAMARIDQLEAKPEKAKPGPKAKAAA